MASTRHDREANLRGVQIITALYSLLFVSLIAVGYYLLFQSSLLVAVATAIFFPCLAWSLAKWIGSQQGGIRAHIPLFAALLAISALGVFNSLLLNLEGRRVFAESIDDSYDRFDHLRQRAGAELSKGGSDSPLAHIARVNGLKAALFSEIRNPLNCGQGPEARKIVASLQEELPGFRPLSTPHVDCKQNAKVIDDYDARITELMDGAPWSNQSLIGVVKDADAAKKELQDLGKQTEDSFVGTLIREVKPQLEAKGARYRDLYERLPQTDDAAAGLPSRLELRSVESLGEWSQIVYLLIDRRGKPTTYIYLALAFFVDWLMVYLFELVRSHRRRAPGGDAGAGLNRGFA